MKKTQKTQNSKSPVSDNFDTNTTGDGNNDPSPTESPEVLSDKLKKVRSRKWCCCLFPDETQKTQNLENLILKIKSLRADKWGYGVEKAPTTGTVHIHVYLEFKNAKTKYSLAKHFGKSWIQPAKGSAVKNAIYFSKGDGKVECNFNIPKKVKILKEEQFYPWQKDIINLLEQEADDRTVHWYWSKKGCVGKTALCKYLAVRHPEKVLLIDGKVADICNGLNNFHEKHEIYPEIVIMNLARNQKMISYRGIEKIKDGLIVNTKYEVSTHVFNSPHLVIFANEEPDRKELSADRWHIVELV